MKKKKKENEKNEKQRKRKRNCNGGKIFCRKIVKLKDEQKRNFLLFVAIL